MKKGIIFLLIFMLMISMTSIYAISDRQSVQYDKNNSGLISDKVVEVKPDNKGGVWFATGGSGAVYIDASGNWTVYKQADGLKNNYLNGVTFDQNGNTFFATNDGVSSLTKDNKWINYYVNSNKVWAETINTVTADAKGGLWHGVSNYGAYYKDASGDWTIYNSDNSSLPSNDVKKIVLDSKGGVWFATHPTYDKLGGVAYLDKDGKWTTYTTKNSKLPSDRVHDIHLAKDGSVWIGTTNGLAQLKDGSWKLYKNNTVAEYNVRAITEDTDGNIYAGTWSWAQGLLVINASGALTKYTTSNSALQNNYIYDLDFDANENLWVVTNDGITLLNGDSNGVIQMPTQPMTPTQPQTPTRPVQPKEVTVYINGQLLNLDTPPIIIEGSTLVSMRAFLEALGQTVKWNNEERKVTATGIKTIELKIGESTGLIDGVVSDIKEPAKLINDKTMVPLRWIAEALNYNVAWDQTSYVVQISK